MNDTNTFTNPWLQWQHAAVDETLNTVERMKLLPSLLDRAKRIPKGVTPSEVVYEEDRLKLIHYVSDKPPRYRTPLVFVYALVNRPYILDLKAGRSVIANFVERGFDTYLVDWGVPTDADRHLTLDDYINGYLVNVMDHLRERTAVKQLNVLGYCMGGTMSAMFTALHAEYVKNLILLAAPIDFSTRDGLLNVWTQSEYFDVDKFVDAFGNCPAEFLQAGFLMLRPVQNLLQKPMDFYEHMHEEKYLEDFLTTEEWLQDNLVPCAQSSPFNDFVGSKDRQSIMLQGSGHIGLAIGGRAQKELWPQACDWLAQRNQYANTRKTKQQTQR